MNPFAITRPKSHAQAAELLKDGRFKLPVLKGGGMDVVDHMKEGLAEPDVLIDVRGLRLADRAITADSKGIRFESSTTLAALSESADLLKHCPVIPQAVVGAATPQVRNVATAAGNLLQRPRCWYYRNEQFVCLKKGGATCFAAEGENKYHAIFGEGPCHIVHPSNLAPALLVTGAVVHLTGGKRDQIKAAELFHMPDTGVRSEHNLEPGEVITHITANPAPTSGFYYIKEKYSYDWPLAAAAVALDLDGEKVRAARVCAGAVAPIPWMLPNVEQALAGCAIGDHAAVRAACMKAGEGAKPLAQNAYKVRLLPVAIHRAILKAAGRPYEGRAEDL